MEFLIDDVSIDGNVYRVTGVCNSGSIKLNSDFTKVYKSIGQKDAKFLRCVKLKVKRIITYRHDLDELARGMSGELWLEGEKGLEIRFRESLVGED